ncbi:MAG TPA: N-6 DNA methylase, partial [Nitrosomonas nitrosa]|nr:N-6 DNA methylase [Nitrosomonas nitrosa]
SVFILGRNKCSTSPEYAIEEDLVECVIGLGPNLFYNSPMEACLLITKTNKEPNKKGKVLFINAVKEVKQESNIGYLEQKHIDKIFSAYRNFSSQDSFAILVDTGDVLAKNANMAINLYIRSDSFANKVEMPFASTYEKWQQSSDNLKASMEKLLQELA